MLGASGIGSDERKRNLSCCKSIKFSLSFLSSLTKALHSEGIIAKIKASITLELRQQMLEKNFIEILSSEECITIGGLNLENTPIDLQNGNIKSSSSKIENSNDLAVSLIESIREGSSSGLVDDTHHFETSNLTGILSGLSLGIIEVGRHSDDGLGNRASKEAFSSLLHLAQNHGTDLGRGVLGALALDPAIGATIGFH
mmetsp:Transcript_7796/g.11604  ORF Transcript_7796/g.11604 Transcript_7796/m.11604 type:complete len:199 (+) Transcript_7796:1158-1754(+)